MNVINVVNECENVRMWGMWWNECDQCGEMETEYLEEKKLQAIL
jgi:hypothetical protein